MSQEFLTDDTIKALKQCIIEHVVLRTVIQDADTENPQLVRVSEMNLLQHLDIVHDIYPELDMPQRLQQLLEKAHNEPWNNYDTRPPWRIYILPLRPIPGPPSLRYHIAFACSHALADGMSGAAFHRTFLRALKGVERLEHDSNPLWDVSSGAELLPPLERAATLPISWSFLLRPVVNEFLPAWFANTLGLRDTRADVTWCGASTRPKRSDLTKILRTSARTASIPCETLQNVLNACKSHNARLTSLLNHLTARALSAALRLRSQHYSRFIAETAIDLRKCIPNAKNCMANYNSGVSETLSAPEHPEQVLSIENWKAIRQSTELLSERSSTLADQLVALLKYVNSVRAWVAKQATKPASASFGMSNLGLMKDLSNADMEAGQSWRIEDVVFSQSADGVGPPLNVNVASAEGGALIIVVTWWPGMLGVNDEGRFVEEVCASLVDQLEIIAR